MTSVHPRNPAELDDYLPSTPQMATAAPAVLMSFGGPVRAGSAEFERRPEDRSPHASSRMSFASRVTVTTQPAEDVDDDDANGISRVSTVLSCCAADEQQPLAAASMGVAAEIPVAMRTAVPSAQCPVSCGADEAGLATQSRPASPPSRFTFVASAVDEAAAALATSPVHSGHAITMVAYQAAVSRPGKMRGGDGMGVNASCAAVSDSPVIGASASLSNAATGGAPPLVRSASVCGASGAAAKTRGHHHLAHLGHLSLGDGNGSSGTRSTGDLPGLLSSSSSSSYGGGSSTPSPQRSLQRAMLENRMPLAVSTSVNGRSAILSLQPYDAGVAQQSAQLDGSGRFSPFRLLNHASDASRLSVLKEAAAKAKTPVAAVTAATPSSPMGGGGGVGGAGVSASSPKRGMSIFGRSLTTVTGSSSGSSSGGGGSAPLRKPVALQASASTAGVGVVGGASASSGSAMSCFGMGGTGPSGPSSPLSRSSSSTVMAASAAATAVATGNGGGSRGSVFGRSYSTTAASSVGGGSGGEGGGGQSPSSPSSPRMCRSGSGFLRRTAASPPVSLSVGERGVPAVLSPSSPSHNRPLTIAINNTSAAASAVTDKSLFSRLRRGGGSPRAPHVSVSGNVVVVWEGVGEV